MIDSLQINAAENSNTSSSEWNAVYTRHQHEKTVAENLTGNGFEVFLPTYNVIRQWADRKKCISLPLFPSYVFVRDALRRSFKILTLPGVHSLVTFAGRPAPIPDSEIDGIRKAVESKYPVEPHPFLRCGDWVRVRRGALAGLEGILVRKKDSCRLILSLELLGRSVAVEVDAFSIQPLTRRAPLLLVSPVGAERFANY